MSVHGKRFNARASRLAVGAEELVIISYPVCREPPASQRSPRRSSRSSD